MIWETKAHEILIWDILEGPGTSRIWECEVQYRINKNIFSWPRFQYCCENCKVGNFRALDDTTPLDAWLLRLHNLWKLLEKSRRSSRKKEMHRRVCVVSDVLINFNNWLSGEKMVCSICQFPWCKHSHQGWFQITNMR